MSNFRVQLDDPRMVNDPTITPPKPAFESFTEPKRRAKRPFVVVGAVIASIIMIAGIGGFLYYQSLKRTPQYSLALLVDAAKHDDKQTVNELIDIDAVVDDFMPQIMTKPVELYGPSIPASLLQEITTLPH